MRFRRFPLWLAAVAVLALTPVRLEAHLPPPQTRAFESANGQFVLVLLMSVEDRAERRDASEYDPRTDGPVTQTELWDWAERVARQEAIEAKYPRSGLYRNDGSTELIWPSPYITVCRDVFVANDGRHVVAAKDMDSTCWDSDIETLVFYASGKKIAGRDHIEALPCFWMRSLIAKWADIRRPYDAAMDIDDDEGVFIVDTTQYDVLKFDLASGRLASQRSPWPWSLAALAIGPPIGFSAWRRRMRSRRDITTGRRQGIGFSLREMLAVTALIAAALAAARVWGSVAATCAVIAICGALVARIRAARTVAWFAGAAAALYAAYMTLLSSAMIDSALFDGLTLLKIWLDDDSSR